jgi:NADPH-dependent 2,4-dienoyl-CoA reductase/sulfur reductase-like enzyme
MSGPRRISRDAVVIGGGAAGIAAAIPLLERGYRVAIIEREERLGGILMQCIHNGFGLHQFKRELTGPEYAEEYIELLAALPADVYAETAALRIEEHGGRKRVFACSAAHGAMLFETEVVICAMGCRERNRGAIGIPGSRPAGVFTAGLAQRLLNIEGCIPAKKAVIIGSGDIGLIMARRLSWTGASVGAVVEILPYPSGLTRNIVQCLEDFSIPLYLSHAVTRIFGRDRVEGVDISPLVNGVPQHDKRFSIACDTVLLSIGLIPENELTRDAGVTINPGSNGPYVDQFLRTSVDGIYACGNVLHVHDLVDFVSMEGRRCGMHAAERLQAGRPPAASGVPIEPGANVKYVVPNRCGGAAGEQFYLRSLAVKDSARLTVAQGDGAVLEKKLRRVRPAEMLSFTLSREACASIDPSRPLRVSLH